MVSLHHRHFRRQRAAPAGKLGAHGAVPLRLIGIATAWSILAAAPPAVLGGLLYSTEAASARELAASGAAWEGDLRERKNAWTVGIAGGLISGTYMRFVDEMASALNDGDQLRILPIVSYGAASNLEDLLYLRGVDAAVTQSDVFEYFRDQRHTPNLERRIQYIIRMPISELHILARQDVRSLEDLRGKKVNFGPAGTGASLTGNTVFKRLGIEVQQVSIDQPTALQKLSSGEVDAIARVIPKPIDFFAKIPAGSGLHLVPVPYGSVFQDLYTLGEFTKSDYPSLLQGEDRVDTIAVPAVLAVFNWPKGSDRYRRVRRLVEYLFARWDTTQHPPYHAKWRDINLAASVPGWTRFSVAQEMLERSSPPAAANDVEARLSKDFDEFLTARSGTLSGPLDRETLFRDFLQWRERSQRTP